MTYPLLKRRPVWTTHKRRKTPRREADRLIGVLARIGLGALLLSLSGCLELGELRGVGPVVRLAATQEAIEASPGESTSVSVQALDVNGEGVSGAWVTLARFDATRLSWPDAPSGSDAITVQTKRTTATNVAAEGLAVATLKVAELAPAGDAAVIAMVKTPADDAATLTARITVHVVSSADGGAGGSPPVTAGSAGHAQQDEGESVGGSES